LSSDFEKGAASVQDHNVKDYMAKNQIFDHPVYGFCKMGDVTIDEDNRSMTLSLIPVLIVYNFTIDTKTGEQSHDL
jgi:hypothetical protein